VNGLHDVASQEIEPFNEMADSNPVKDMNIQGGKQRKYVLPKRCYSLKKTTGCVVIQKTAV
jgi:hypothetical protein